MKIFLSHNSTDKEFVKPIAQMLGHNNIVYDELTFDIGQKNIDEIVAGLEHSNLFVVFLSSAALASEWVQTEMELAIERLKNKHEKLIQIFPLIIDNEVTYDDSRIPEYLRKGESSYNLRYVANPQIAYRRIKEQQIKLKMTLDRGYEESRNFFYGRNTEVKCALERMYNPDKEGLKCMVVSGMEGIGKKSFVKKVLRESGTYKNYFEPCIISVGRDETIDDIILKISDLGFGAGIRNKLAEARAIDEKIPILTDLLEEIGRMREHVIIEDLGSIVLYDRSIVYWFNNAIKNAEIGYVVSITTNISIEAYHSKRYGEMAFVVLSELGISERMGMLSASLRKENIELEREDVMWFSKCLSGHPLEINFCVQELKERGLEYLKNNSYKIAQVSFSNCVAILNLIGEHWSIDDRERIKNKMYGLLSFLSQFGTTPLSYIQNIIKIDNEYNEIYHKLMMFTICTKIGSMNESVKVNSVISQYIQRNKFKIPQEIDNFVKKQLKKFNEHIEEDEYLDLCNHSEISYFIKENIKERRTVPPTLLYSTLYLSSVIELYDNRKYDTAISIVEAVKESEEFECFDSMAQSHIMFYYCLSLCRKRNPKASAMIDYFATIKEMSRFHTLKGFMYRMIGEIDKSIEEYKKALDIKPTDNMALRELVKDYRLVENYDIAFAIAKNNYLRAKDNLYHIEGYFDCLLHKENRTDEENAEIERLMSVVSEINERRENVLYYEMKAAYYVKYKRDFLKAEEIIASSLSKFQYSTVLHKLRFEVSEIYHQDVNKMEEAVNDLEILVNTGRRNFSFDIYFRKAIIDAYNGVPYDVIKITYLNKLPRTMRKMAEQKIEKILGKSCS